MHIDTWLSEAAHTLKQACIASYRLDAELLLSDILGKERPYLHAHGDEMLTPDQLARSQAYLRRRQQRTPLAYILGRREFYGRNFAVTPYVLIPRPETEALVEAIEALALPADARIADIGTGSGALAITLKLNQPSRRVYATDISPEALAVAQANAEALGADTIFLQGHLAQPLRSPVDVIVANLPYVDASWERSPETDFEPSLALFAQDGGLALIKQVIDQAETLLNHGGHILLEADPRQHDAIATYAKAHHFSVSGAHGFVVSLVHA